MFAPARPGLLSWRREVDDAVGAGRGDHGENGEELEGGPDHANEDARSTSDAVDPEQDKAQDREKIEARAEKAQTAHDEHRIEEKDDDAHDVEEGEGLVRPLEGLGGEDRAEGDKSAHEEAEVAERDAHDLGDGREGRAVAVEEGADVAEGAGEDRSRVIGQEEVADGQDRGGDHAQSRDETRTRGASSRRASVSGAVVTLLEQHHHGEGYLDGRRKVKFMGTQCRSLPKL